MTGRRVTEGLLARALRAATKEGHRVAGYEIAADGTVRVTFGENDNKHGSSLEERAEAYAQARRVARRRG
jgi:hypothetical protein